MINRQNQIIKLLMDNEWITGSNLSIILGVSDRTIRSDIKNINNKLGYTLIHSDNKLGYKIKNKNIKLNKNNKIAETPYERKMYILKKLLHKNEIDIYNDIIGELFVSDSTLLNDINDINKDLYEYKNISVNKNGSKIKIIGDEKSIRKLYKDLLVKETKNNLFNINQIALLYKNFDLIEMKNIFEKLLKEYNYTIDEINLPILMIHIGVTIDRIISHNTLDIIEYDDEIKNSIEYIISKKFFNEINKKFNIDSYEAEVILFVKTLMSKNRNYSKKLSNIIEYKIIVKDLLKYIYENYGINFLSDEELINSLCVHIEALIARIKLNTPTTNLFLDEIKKRYPFVFELSLISAHYLNQKLNVIINEEEIGFLCLHLGIAYEKNYMHKYKVLLISPQVNLINSNLKDNINKLFSNKLEIIDRLNYFEEKIVIKINPDIIISDTQIYHSLEIPTIFVSPFFLPKDESNILQTINILDNKRLKKEYGKYLDKILSSENFYTNMDFNNKEEAIKFLCDKLLKKGYITKKYYNSVINREKMSSTSFSQGFAIPHSIDTDDIIKSGISIMILNNPINWGNYRVHMIFLLTIKNINTPFLKLFFNWIDMIASDVEKFSKYLTCKSFKEFIEILNKDST